jgi:hypothetical protein
MRRAVRIFAPFLEKLPRVAWKYRCISIVVGAAALAASSLGISGPALAADECGPLVGGSVTCSPGGTPPLPGNPYPTGITYIVSTGDLNVTLQNGVNVIPTGAVPISAVQLQNSNVGGSILLTDDGAIITNTAGLGGKGLNVSASASIFITSVGKIDRATRRYSRPFNQAYPRMRWQASSITARA